MLVLPVILYSALSGHDYDLLGRLFSTYEKRVYNLSLKILKNWVIVSSTSSAPRRREWQVDIYLNFIVRFGVPAEYIAKEEEAPVPQSPEEHRRASGGSTNAGNEKGISRKTGGAGQECMIKTVGSWETTSRLFSVFFKPYLHGKGIDLLLAIIPCEGKSARRRPRSRLNRREREQTIDGVWGGTSKNRTWNSVCIACR